MARQRKLSPERKAFINSLLEHYQPNDAQDVQEMLKDLLGDTLQGMLEAEMDEKLGYSNYPVCVAKTQYSISDDPKKLGYPKDYEIFARDIDILNGCGMIVVYLNDIMTMPGLSKNPSYLNIDVDDDGNIVGIF